MTPGDRDMLATVNLLALLLRSRLKVPNLAELERCTLTVTEEHLHTNNIQIAVFSNTLQKLADRGYLTALSIYEKKYHEEVKNVFNSEAYKNSKDLDKPLSQGDKTAILKAFSKISPSGMSFNEESFLKGDVSFRDLIEEARPTLEDLQGDEVARLVLFPFRDICKLLDKLNNGISLNDVTDEGVWYDSGKFEFHVGTNVIPTAYQGKPNIEHSILSKITDYFEDGVIYYDELNDHSSASLYSNLKKFVRKDPTLPTIFKVHKDRLEFNKQAFL